MSISRRQFIVASTAAVAVPAGRMTGVASVASGAERSDPWLEVDAAAMHHNAAEIGRLCGGRPILAVVKNNAYGLGLEIVGPILDRIDSIAGLAVVKTGQALALRDAGVAKPVLLMGLFSEQDALELVARDIELAPYSDGVDRVLARVAARARRPVAVQLYIDTGMGRLGMSFRRAPEWMAEIAAVAGIEIKGTFSALTEEDDFDPEQLQRFIDVAAEARRRGVDHGRLHMASSHGLFFRPDFSLDMVRPGLALYGAYPSGAEVLGTAELEVAFRLKARVVRVDRLEPGDGVSYGRNYVAERPTWTATLPVGHADGYPRRAVNGCEVLIGGRTYPVIGAVSASHTIVELGPEATAKVGDVATLIGPEAAAIHPNAVAARCEISVYDVLMHLNAGLPKRVRSA
jgi:alanine racemase